MRNCPRPPAAIRLGLAVWLVVSGAGCAPKTYHALARVLLVKNAARALDSRGNARALHPADVLEAGSRLSVPEGAAAAISLVPGVAALAVGPVELVLNEMELTRDGPAIGQRRARVTILGGTARFSVASPPDRRTELEVVLETTAGAAGGEERLLAVPGTLFGVAGRGGQGGARVTCARGAVGCFPTGAAPGGWILAGSFRDFGPGAAPAARLILEDAEARREAADLFDALDDLEVLQESQRDLAPFLRKQ